MYSWFHLTAQSKSILFSTSGRRTTRGLLASTKGKNNHKPPLWWTRALMHLFKSLGTSNSNLWLKARLVLSKPSESSVHFKQIWVHWEQWTIAVWPRNMKWERLNGKLRFTLGFHYFPWGLSRYQYPDNNLPDFLNRIYSLYPYRRQPNGKIFCNFLWRLHGWIKSHLSGIFTPTSFRDWIDSFKILVSNF